MNKKFIVSNKSISAFIIIFPSIMLLIYAIVSYNIFIDNMNSINQKIITHYKVSTEDTTKAVLESRAKTLDNFIDYVNKVNIDFISKMLNSIEINDDFQIILIDKGGKVFFKKAKLDKKSIIKLANKNALYKDKNLISYMSQKNHLGIKVIVYKDKTKCLGDIESLKKSIRKDTSNNAKKSIYLLALVWFGLLLLSFILSIVVFNRLKKYGKELENNNDKIIFSSKQALLGELLPMIAHQWRQPLNKIASILMSMRFEISKPHPNSNTLDLQSQEIEDSVELMSQTIDDFRTFYRPKKEPSNVDLALLVRKSLFFLNELLTRKKIKISHTLPSVMLKIHENEFLQVLINLIKNASDAVAVQGNINIILRELPNDKIELRIEDDGTGIPEDKLDKIFEAHESSKVASMGLGLYMSKIIIEDRLGGTIRAYNTPKGAGFIIILNR